MGTGAAVSAETNPSRSLIALAGRVPATHAFARQTATALETWVHGSSPGKGCFRQREQGPR